MGKEMKMGVPTTEEGWELEMEILQMLEDGLIEVCGENENGEALIRITDKGRRVYETFQDSSDDGDK